MALVNWETICSPKEHGVLNLRNPKKVNCVSGVNIWWRWVTHNHEPWEKWWHNINVGGWEKGNLIHLFEEIPGSHIWKNATQGRRPIQAKNVWDIRKGKIALT